jgi:ribosome recycling factor
MDETQEFKSKAQKAIDFLKEDLKSIRTGRATPSLVENLTVEAYGGSTKLRMMELATIVTEGPSALSISPFDPSTLQDIERAILKSPLGMSPIVQGSRIIIKIPPLSEEQREKYIKLAAGKVEEKKVQIRAARDDARRSIKEKFEKKEITEDAKFRVEKEIDTSSSKFMEEVEVIKDKKEQEIREV